MPLLSLEMLEYSGELLALARSIPRFTTGVVLTTGQASSGRLTTLMAFALSAARPGQPVALLSDRPEDLDPFRPWPEGWSERVVAGAAAQWQAALDEVPPGALPVVTQLTRANAAAVFAAGGERLVLASVDTPLVGADVAYVLREMGVPDDRFAAAVRCVWSQLLLRGACHCALPANLSAEELEALFPRGNAPALLKMENGCADCGGTGTNDRMPACEAFVVEDGDRATLALAVQQGSAPRLPGGRYVHIHDVAHGYLTAGRIGIATYRDAIVRNPLLRAQNALEREQAYSQRMGRMFQKFVSPEVQRRLLDTRSLESIVRGESREISCLFCDIRGFTSRAETRTPEALFRELNRYFSVVVDAVLRHEGTIDKFIGDAVMVVFGAPLQQPDHAARALRCALAIRASIDDFNATESPQLPIVAGIGVNTGAAVAGVVGTDERMEYTVLGDTVNVAARLESRASPGQVLVSDATRAASGGEFRFHDVGELELKGKAQRTRVHELLGAADPTAAA